MDATLIVSHKGEDKSVEIPPGRTQVCVCRQELFLHWYQLSTTQKIVKKPIVNERWRVIRGKKSNNPKLCALHIHDFTFNHIF